MSSGLVTFRIVPHSTRRCNIVEVLMDGKPVATITPTGPDAIRLISVHVAESSASNGPARRDEDGRTQRPHIPFWSFQFRPRRWNVGPDGQIIYLED